MQTSTFEGEIDLMLHEAIFFFYFFAFNIN